MKFDDIEFNIVSHHRSNNVKTIKTLLNEGVDKSHIHIFLNDSSTVEDYRTNYPDIEIIADDGGNAAHNRNTVLKHYPDDTYIVVLDDDVTAHTYVEYVDERLRMTNFTPEHWLKIFELLEQPGQFLCFGQGPPQWVVDLFRRELYNDEINQSAACMCMHLPMKELFDEQFYADEDTDFWLNNAENNISDIHFRMSSVLMLSNKPGGIDYEKYNVWDYKFLVIEKNKDKISKITGTRVDYKKKDKPTLFRMDIPQEVVDRTLSKDGKKFKWDKLTCRIAPGNKIHWYFSGNIYGKII